MKCESYWKRNNDDDLIECVDECSSNEITLNNTLQCIEKTYTFKCPYDSPYLYNNICYSSCPTGTSVDMIKGNTCICDNVWLEKNDLIIYCYQKETDKCPFNTHPYLINNTKQCVENETVCSDKGYPKIFNYQCYKECPYFTEENNNKCECKQNDFWYSYKSKEDLREYYECGLNACPQDYSYINGTNKCVQNCADEQLYNYDNVCYDECPSFTKKTKNGYCEFDSEEKDLDELVENIENNVVGLCANLPEGGLVLNNEKASLQIYKLQKGNLNKKQSIMKTNLAYIDLSGCLDKLYDSNGIDKKDEIIVVKLDMKLNIKKLVVNPIEYEFIHEKTGKVLDPTVCEKNEVVISYPITYMLKNKKKLRNLEEDNEEQEILDKFNKGKLINENDNSIDTFNFNSSIYSDICVPVEIDGKDLVLEDRLQYLYPNYSFCESLCTYDYTDFQGERIYCNCTIKSGINTGRNYEAKLYQLNLKETENNQKGPTNIPILQCISKAKISGNAAFYFCIIFIVIEIGLLLLSIFYGIASLIEKMQRKIMKKKEVEYNYNTENDKMKDEKVDKTFKYKNKNENNIIDSNNDSDNKSNRKMKEENIKANPPKYANNYIDEDEKDKKDNDDNVINIKKLNLNKIKDIKDINEKNIETKSDLNDRVSNDTEIRNYLQKNGIETQMGFLQSMKKEQKLLKEKYNHSLINDKFDSIIVIFTSIFDKIYVVKILLLSGKYEIISVMFSLYLLCHMILLTFVTFFYDIKTIKKIWSEENYPSTSYYLSFGFLANVIVWIIYKLFCCLLSNEYKIKKIKKTEEAKKEMKFNKETYKIKRNIIIYSAIEFLLILFCSFYLITFCGIYLGTKTKIFQSYGIAIIEIIIIKIIYGLILGILRKISLYKEIKILYDVVLLFNKYIS